MAKCNHFTRNLSRTQSILFISALRVYKIQTRQYKKNIFLTAMLFIHLNTMFLMNKSRNPLKKYQNSILIL